MRTLLLDTWRGVLWVPPKQGSRGVVDFARIERGLLSLHTAAANQVGGLDFLRYALDILTDSFRRSSRFWQSHIGPLLSSWPDLLRSAALVKWPTLSVERPAEPIAMHPPQALTPVTPTPVAWQEVFPEFVQHSPLAFVPATLGLLWDPESWPNEEIAPDQLADIRMAVERLLGSRSVESSPEWISDGEAIPKVSHDLSLFLRTSIIHLLQPVPRLVNLSFGTWYAGQLATARAIERNWLVHSPVLVQILDPNATRILEASAALFKHWESSAHHLKAFESAAWMSGRECFTYWKTDEIKRLAVEEFASEKEIARLLGVDLSEKKSLEERVLRWQSVAPISSLSALLCFSFSGPAPGQYLESLSHLSKRKRVVAERQLRRAVHLGWNPVERLFLQMMLALIAFREKNFNRAIADLSIEHIRHGTLPVEYRVFEVHALAGAGRREHSTELVRTLLEGTPALSRSARTILDLLSRAYGLTGSAPRSSDSLEEEILCREAALLTQSTGG